MGDKSPKAKNKANNQHAKEKGQKAADAKAKVVAGANAGAGKKKP